MKLKKTILIIFFILIGTFSFAQNRSIQFENLSFQELLEKSKKENKIIFIDCFTTWCGPCKWMDKNVFTNDTVADFYNQNFICAKFDMEKGEGKEIQKKYNINSFPTFLFINDKGKIIYTTLGRKITSLFLQEGKNALNPEMHFDKMVEKLNKGVTDPKELYSYLFILRSAGQESYEKYLSSYFLTQQEQDLTKDYNWKLIQLISTTESREFQYVIKNKELFEQLFSKKEVNTYLKKISINTLGDALSKKDSISYEKAKKQVLSWGMEELVLFVEMSISKQKQDWKKYTKNASIYITKYNQENASELNFVAWTYFEHIEDRAALLQAKNWSKHSTELESSYVNNDTYASILYKLGEKKEAKAAAEKAIELAKKEGVDYKSTEELLKKINALK
jgi:thiol-disulfide isomerase/thioredoxin